MEEIKNQRHYDLNESMDEFFLHYHDLSAKTDIELAIVSMYFAFTSLSTVGFGDFTPRSDYERVLGAIMLLFGVLIFTFIMGKFIEMIGQIQMFYNTFEEDESLKNASVAV